MKNYYASVGDAIADYSAEGWELVEPACGTVTMRMIGDGDPLTRPYVAIWLGSDGRGVAEEY